MRKSIYLRISHHFPQRSPANVVILIFFVSVLIHGLGIWLLKPQPLSQESSKSHEKVTIKFTPTKKMMISERRLEETKAPENPTTLGYQNHKTDKETVLSKRAISTKDNIARRKGLQKFKSYESLLGINQQKYGQSESQIQAQDFDGTNFEVGESLSVNMMAHPLMSYFSKIRQTVELAISPPSQSKVARYMRRQGLEALVGYSVVMVELDRDGNIVSLSLKDSKGHSIIDHHWIDILSEAGPYPRIPKSWAENSIKFNYSYRYSLM